MLASTESELADAKYDLIKKNELLDENDQTITNQKNKINSLNSEVCSLNQQIDPDYTC